MGLYLLSYQPMRYHTLSVVFGHRHISLWADIETYPFKSAHGLTCTVTSAHGLTFTVTTTYGLVYTLMPAHGLICTLVSVHNELTYTATSTHGLWADIPSFKSAHGLTSIVILAHGLIYTGIPPHELTSTLYAHISPWTHMHSHGQRSADGLICTAKIINTWAGIHCYVSP